MAGRLGDILIQQGAITEEQLVSALAAQKSLGDMLGEILLRRGLITLDQLGAALEGQYEVPFLPIVPQAIHPQIARLLPEELARAHMAVPVAVQEGTMTLAMTSPDNIETISEAELITGYRVDPAIVLKRDVQATLDRSWDERTIARQTVVDMKLVELKNVGAKDEADGVLSAVDEDSSPVVRLVQAVLTGAINAGASDIHLEPHTPEMRVRYRMDGELQQAMTIPSHIEEAVVGRIKVMANMDTTERRRPQDGHLVIKEDDTEANLRVSTIPTVGGEKVVLRILDESRQIVNIDQLGLVDRDREVLERLIDKPHGMLLLTGPTGSGKSTTMYAVLSSLNHTERNIVTVEDPVEYHLSGVNQVPANNEFGLGFANALKYIMRQDPDVVMVGEIRDRETASTAVQAALTGHLLISTLHANGAVGTVARLTDLGVDPFKIGGALLASVAQRLLRVICPECKEPCEPNPALLNSLARHRPIPEDATFFHGRGCKRCLGSGYVGRTPIFEIMLVSKALSEAIEMNLPTTKLQQIAQAEGMVELPVAGLELALAGQTTIEEVFLKVST